MLILRQKLQPHSELVYMCAVVLLCAIRSVGLGSKEAGVLTAIALLAVLYKIVLTDYTKKELIVGAILFGLLGYALVVNGDKMLLMSMIVIWGAKNTDIKRTLLWCLIVRVPLMAGRILLAVTGVLPGSENQLLKTNPYLGTSDWVIIRDYGFYHVNYLYLGLVSIGFLLIICMAKIEQSNRRLFLLSITGYTALLYMAYKVLLCRTGFYLWVVLYILILIAELLKPYEKVFNVLLGLVTYVPVILLILCVTLAIFRKTDLPFTLRYDALFSGRFEHFVPYVSELWKQVFAASEYLKLDNGYFYNLYNYGVLWTCLLIFVMSKTLKTLKEGNEYLPVLALVGIAGYMIGEATPWSVQWNPAILLLAYGFFDMKWNQRSVKAED